ncbi:MAG: hypothetical protein GY801_11070 [bacterium]|nr:hypothetical protein [bacterium]
MSERIPLGEYFVKAGIISQEDLERALQLQKQRGGYLGQILVTEGWITEQTLCKTISETTSVNWGAVDCILIDWTVLQLVPKSVAITFNVLPIFVHKNVLHLAMENPSDTSMLKFIEFKTGLPVKPLLAPVKQIRTMIRKYYYEKVEGPHF